MAIRIPCSRGTARAKFPFVVTCTVSVQGLDNVPFLIHT